MDFLKYRLLYLILSSTLVIGSLLSLFVWRLQPSIDFTGGTLIEYRLSQPTVLNQVREALSKQTELPVASIQTTGEQGLLVKTTTVSQEKAQVFLKTLTTQLQQPVQEVRFETIGPVLGKELLFKTLVAVVITSAFIVGYLAWTFRNVQYGVAAVLAMFHDTLILLGSFSLLGKFMGIEVDTLFVTAVLTTLSFSVHDTVVVFDRIREAQHQYPQTSLKDLANKAITETMSRSLNNSLTIIFMLTALLLLGGEPIKWFVAALLIGTIVGTYSSPFVAVPLLVWWSGRKKS